MRSQQCAADRPYSLGSSHAQVRAWRQRSIYPIRSNLLRNDLEPWRFLVVAKRRGIQERVVVPDPACMPRPILGSQLANCRYWRLRSVSRAHRVQRSSCRDSGCSPIVKYRPVTLAGARLFRLLSASWPGRVVEFDYSIALRVIQVVRNTVAPPFARLLFVKQSQGMAVKNVIDQPSALPPDEVLP